MDQIRPPSRAIMPWSRGTHHNQFTGEFLRREWRQGDHPIPMRVVSNLLAVLKPDYSLALPFFNSEPYRHRSTGTPSTSLDAKAASVANAGERQASTIGISDGRTVNHKICKEGHLEVLEPILRSDGSGSFCILLCWGKDDGCHIIPLSIPSSSDDVATWQAIRQEWYARRGKWREYLPLFGIKRVEIVEVCQIAL
jgi:hypothetical protein